MYVLYPEPVKYIGFNAFLHMVITYMYITFAINKPTI